MSNKLIEKLNQVKSTQGRMNPDQSWVSRNRTEMLAKITESTPIRVDRAKGSAYDQFLGFVSNVAHIFMPQRVLGLARTSLTVMLVAIVAVSSWIATVSASQNSLPGDSLYGVKLATERTELLVTSVIGSDEDEVSTLLKHASTRVGEYQKVRDRSPAQAARAIKSLKKNIESANKRLGKANTNSRNAAGASAVAKVVDEQTSAILTSLESGAENIFDPTGRQVWPGEEEDVADLNKAVSEATELIQDAGVEAVKVLIEHKSEGNESINIAEVKESVEKKIDKLAVDLVEIQDEADQLSEDRVETSESVIGEDSKQAEAASLDTSEQSDNTEEKLNNPKEEVQESQSDSAKEEAYKPVSETAEEKAGEVNKIVEDAEGVVEQAKALVKQNDLLGALEKVKELGVAKKQTKVVVSELRDAVGEEEL